MAGSGGPLSLYFKYNGDATAEQFYAHPRLKTYNLRAFKLAQWDLAKLNGKNGLVGEDGITLYDHAGLIHDDVLGPTAGASSESPIVVSGERATAAALTAAVAPTAAPVAPTAAVVEEAAYRGAKRAKAEEEAIALSDVRSTQWGRICDAAGVKINVAGVPDAQQSADSRLRSKLCEKGIFEWQERDEDQQAEQYIPYLKGIIGPPPRALLWEEGGQKKKTLLTLEDPHCKLGYRKISGNTDMFIVTREAARVKLFRAGLCVLFELKKKPDTDAVCQAMCQLLLANIFSPELRPVVVLTDLRDNWQLYWMDGSTVTGGACGSREAAVMLINQLLEEFARKAEAAKAGGQQAAGEGADQDVPQAIARRLPWLMTNAGGPNMAMLADLEGLLSEEELMEARAQMAVQQVMQLPLFSNLSKAYCRNDSPPTCMYA